jgi:hypothetical protein
MANFAGMKLKDNPMNLLIEMNPSRVQKDNNGAIVARYLTVQVDQSLRNPDKVRDGSSPVAPGQVDSNPYLASATKTGKNGSEYVEHAVNYKESQYQKMLEAAGNKKTVVSKTKADGTAFDVEVLGVKGIVTFNSAKLGILNTAAPMEASTNPRFGKTILSKQAAVTAAAKEVREAAIAERKGAVPAPEQENEAQAGEELGV